MKFSPEQRERLVDRRDRLNAHRKRVADQKWARQFAVELDNAGVAFEVVEDDPPIRVVRERFPVATFGYVEWEDVDGSFCLAVEEPSVTLAQAWLSQLGREFGIGRELVSVVYADESLPSIRLRFDELIKHLNTVIDYTWDNWIYEEQNGLLIEYFHHGVWSCGCIAVK